MILSAWGPTLDRRRLRRRATTHSPVWERWAAAIVRRRVLAAAAGLAIVGALAIPALSINTGQPSASSLGGTSPAARAFHRLQAAGVPEAVSFPIQVLTRGADRGAAAAASVVARDSGVWASWIARVPAGSGDARLVTVIPTTAGDTASGRDTVRRVRNTLAVAGTAAQVGGDTAANLDFTAAIYNRLPVMLAAISLITFLLLARSFRSIPLAIKAVALNLVSLGAAFGFIVLFWQSGHGSHLLYGVHATHAIRNWAPIIMFAFLFGISMDYEVFVLARMREEYDRSGDPHQAIVASIGRTGRLITCAALILGISFASLSTTNDTSVQVPATGLAVGVLLDAIVVRTLLVPAIAALLGPFNWWMPEGVARALRSPRSASDQACSGPLSG